MSEKRSKRPPRRPTRIRIDVTDDDIARAQRNDSLHCVVSQAIARTIKDAVNIETDIQCIRFTVPAGDDGGRERWIYYTPAAVQGYVVAFDAGEPVEPFSFRLYDPTRKPIRQATARGRAAHKAYDAARKEAERAGATAEEAKAAGREAYREAAKTAGEGPMFTAPTGYRAQPPPPSRSKQRTYGHRVLRVNQAKT